MQKGNSNESISNLIMLPKSVLNLLNFSLPFQLVIVLIKDIAQRVTQHLSLLSAWIAQLVLSEIIEGNVSCSSLSSWSVEALGAGNSTF